MAEESGRFAPGWPGIPPRWTSSAKSGLGTAVSRDSRVWFTLSHGIFNEIYYPRVDHACTRDLGFIVTDGQTYFSEEKPDARSVLDEIAWVGRAAHGRFDVAVCACHVPPSGAEASSCDGHMTNPITSADSRLSRNRIFGR